MRSSHGSCAGEADAGFGMVSLRRRLHVKQNEVSVREWYRNMGGNAEEFSSLVYAKLGMCIWGTFYVISVFNLKNKPMENRVNAARDGYAST